MKTLLLLCYCLLVLPLFSQKMVSEQELKRYEWIVYNKNVADSSEIFPSDTLLLVKSYELESLEPLTGEDGQRIDKLYPRCWRLDLTLNEPDTSGQVNEFYFHFIDLHKAAVRKSMEVDSATYQLIRKNPNIVRSETAPVLIELDNMQNGDVIQMVDPYHQFYYLEKTGNKLRVLNTLNKRVILEPKGIAEGFWTFSKKDQLITFSNEAREIHFLFRVERIDKIRIRLIRTAP